MAKQPPKYVIRALNAASGLTRCYVNSERANNWLCSNLGLFTDDNEHKLSGFVVNFDWHIQKWYVSQ